MGRIVAPYGVKGWVRIEPYSAEPDSLSAYHSWWVGRNGAWRELKVAQCVLQHGTSLVARLEGCVEREALPQSANNEYYWADLVGLKVVNLQDQALGVVAGLFENGAHALMRVVDGETERLLPFVEQVVRQVEMAEGRIRVEWELDW